MKRETLHSSKGKKLYAKRAEDGTFKDIQTYKKAHAQDIKKASVDEELKLLRRAAKKILVVIDHYLKAGLTDEDVGDGERDLLKWRENYGKK